MSNHTTRVEHIRKIAEGVLAVRLAGQDLPAFEPGAHIDVFLGNGLVRQYSLINPLDSAAGARPSSYEIAVGLNATSSGGSSWIHENLAEGATILVSEPRNHFALNATDRPLLLVAGGIGITPIRAMVQICELRKRSWRLVYAARSRRHAAFADEFTTIAGSDRLHFHFDDEHAGKPLDVELLRTWIEPDCDIYCCGPAGLMNSVRERLDHRGARLHFEWFNGAPQSHDNDQPFDVVLNQSGRRVTVPSGKSALDALEDAGVIVASVCKEGICGTCECAVLAGEIDHRDKVLTDEERAAMNTMMVCVSRARGAELTLDL